MCLSTVYLKKREDGNTIAEEVSELRDSNGTIEIKTLFGETKNMEGYSIAEVNLTENYVVLRKKEQKTDE